MTRYLYIQPANKRDTVVLQLEGNFWYSEFTPLQKIQIKDVTLLSQFHFNCGDGGFHFELHSVMVHSINNDTSIEVNDREDIYNDIDDTKEAKYDTSIIHLQNCSSLMLLVVDSIFINTFFNVELDKASNITFVNVTMQSDFTMQSKMNTNTSTGMRATGIRVHYPVRDSKHHILIMDSIFEGHNQSLSEEEPNAAIVVKADKSDSEIKVTILNSTFNSNMRGLDFSLKGMSDIRVDGCRFTDHHSIGAGGATRFTATLDTGFGSISNVEDTQILIRNCEYANNSASTNQNMTRKDLYFQTRSAGYGGAIHLFLKAKSPLHHHGLVEIDSCYFENNTAEIQGGTFFFNPDISVLIKDSEVINSFSATKAKLGDLLYASGNMTVENTQMKVVHSGESPVISYQAADPSNGRLEMDLFVLTCPPGHEVYVVDSSSLAAGGGLEVLRISCYACLDGYYSLNSSTMEINDTTITVYNNIECEECPYGAVCDTGILNLGTFWGSLDDDNYVSMYICPEDYCEENADRLIAFDYCSSEREGTLCGRCSEGYSESMFGTECIANEECGMENWHITLIIASYGILYLLFFMFEADAARYIQKLIRKVKTRSRDEIYEEDNIADAGLFQIFMYFIQTSVLLKVTIVINEDKSYDHIHRPQDILPSALVDGVKQVFNFNILALHSKSCLVADLTPTLKVIIKSLFIYYLFFIMFIFYILSGCCCIFKPVNKRPKFGEVTWNSRILATVVSLFLYTYQYIAEDAFILLNCVEVDGQSVMFHEGHIKCFQPWQSAVVVLVCVYVIPFFLVLLFGPKLLEKKLISVAIFFIAFMFPLVLAPYFILLYIRCINTKPIQFAVKNDPKYDTVTTCCGKGEKVADDIVDVMSGPYKNNVMKGICWEGVINFRRLILVVLFTFINDRLIRQMSLAFVCFIILLVHIFTWPFKSAVANVAETVSLSLLLVISGTNLVKASFFYSQAVPRGANYLLIVVYEWIEAICFGILPVVIVFLMSMALAAKTTISCINRGSHKDEPARESTPVSPSSVTPGIEPSIDSSGNDRNWSMQTTPIQHISNVFAVDNKLSLNRSNPTYTE